jgi:hypothetical protein
MHLATLNAFWSDNVTDVCLAANCLIFETGLVMEEGKKGVSTEYLPLHSSKERRDAIIHRQRHHVVRMGGYHVQSRSAVRSAGHILKPWIPRKRIPK